MALPNVNDNGLFSNSPADITSGGWRPGNQDMLPAAQNLGDLVGRGERRRDQIDLSDVALTDYSGPQNTYLTSTCWCSTSTRGGISLSNWIANSVYFRSNVTFNATTGEANADPNRHHTSWVDPGDGILTLPVGGQVADITDTLLQYLGGGQDNNGTYTPWPDGLAALGSLATAGATAFSAAASLTDPATGQSYWSELRVWQGANQDGVSQAGELKSLDSLGITPISLTSSGNQGESIDGSAVTSCTTYTTSSGSLGEAAAVDLSTDTTGDVIVNTAGGVTITSTRRAGRRRPRASSIRASRRKATASRMERWRTRRWAPPWAAALLRSSWAHRAARSRWPRATLPPIGWAPAPDRRHSRAAPATRCSWSTRRPWRMAAAASTSPRWRTPSRSTSTSTADLQEVIGGQGGGVFNASGTNWNVFVQATAGNNIIIGGIAGGAGDDLIEAGSGGSVIHAGSGNDVVSGGSGTDAQGQPNSD